MGQEVWVVGVLGYLYIWHLASLACIQSTMHVDIIEESEQTIRGGASVPWRGLNAFLFSEFQLVQSNPRMQISHPLRLLFAKGRCPPARGIHLNVPLGRCQRFGFSHDGPSPPPPATPSVCGLSNQDGICPFSLACERGAVKLSPKFSCVQTGGYSHPARRRISSPGSHSLLILPCNPRPL